MTFSIGYDPLPCPSPPLLCLFWSNSDLSIADWLLTNKSPYRVDTCVKAFWRPFWATFFCCHCIGPKGTHTQLIPLQVQYKIMRCRLHQRVHHQSQTTTPSPSPSSSATSAPSSSSSSSRTSSTSPAAISRCRWSWRSLYEAAADDDGDDDEHEDEDEGEDAVVIVDDVIESQSRQVSWPSLIQVSHNAANSQKKKKQFQFRFQFDFLG